METIMHYASDRGYACLPVHTLDEVVASKHENDETHFQMSCTVKGHGRVVVKKLTDAVLREVCYDYQPDTSPAFVAVSLALHYRAPLTIQRNTAAAGERDGPLVPSETVLRQRFADYQCRSDALQPTDRSATNIEQSFEIHQNSRCHSQTRRTQLSRRARST